MLRRQARNEIAKGWGLESKAKFSCMKTVPIEQAVEQYNATQVFTNGSMGAEPRAAVNHGLGHYRQGLRDKFVSEC